MQEITWEFEGGTWCEGIGFSSRNCKKFNIRERFIKLPCEYKINEGETKWA